MATGGGGGVRGRKRRSPHGLGGHDTILQRLVCPAVYQKETFMFLYDFFMCRASTSPLRQCVHCNCRRRMTT